MKLPPGPKGHPIIGNLLEPRGDAVAYFKRCFRDYGDIVFVRFLGVPMCLVNRPDCIESVLVTQNNNFEKSKDYRALRRVLGNGLLTSDGKHKGWHKAEPTPDVAAIENTRSPQPTA